MLVNLFAATDVLRKGLTDLCDVCEHILNTFEVSVLLLNRLKQHLRVRHEYYILVQWLVETTYHYVIDLFIFSMIIYHLFVTKI